jgi:trehalose-6-phosphate synthase
MPLEERQKRMQWLRNQVQKNDVHHWLSYFMRALKQVNPEVDFF